MNVKTNFPEWQNFKETRIDITGYLCPFRGNQPWLIQLPTITGVYVPVFKKKEDLLDTMRYLKINKFEIVLVGNTVEFNRIVADAGVKLCVNPRTYNGVTVWDSILPHSDGIISAP